MILIEPRPLRRFAALAFCAAVFAACSTPPAPGPPEAPTFTEAPRRLPAPGAKEASLGEAPAADGAPAANLKVPAAESACLRIDRIEVWKQERMLRAYCKNGAVVSMNVAIGRQEVGPKIGAGDLRTPEGSYRIVAPANQGRFHLFIPIDYPARADADTAWLEDRISATDYWRIVSALMENRPPPGDTPLGGDIGFHGEGERWEGDSQDHDWTYGCIAVTDPEIEFLAERIEVGVPVWIHP